MSYYHHHLQVFPSKYLSKLEKSILDCPYFSVNNLNRDFVGTKGFSLVFRRSHISQVQESFPYLTLYLDRVAQDDCNAFYLNPLLLEHGSRVDPHIDRSLRSYCKTINPPLIVSVLYIAVPTDLEGGELILRTAKRQVGQIAPQVNSLVFFQGDLTHLVKPVLSPGKRLSLVCEQYSLVDEELEQIPEIKLESRAVVKQSKKR